MENIIVPIICALVGSGSATAIVAGITTRRAEKHKVETGESQGLRWLMQDRLEYVARSYIAKGHITFDELKNWNRGHYIYHVLLNGNGDLDTLKEALQDLYNSCKGEIM